MSDVIGSAKCLLYAKATAALALGAVVLCVLFMRSIFAERDLLTFGGESHASIAMAQPTGNEFSSGHDKGDFTREVPLSLRLDTLVLTLQRAATEAGVATTSLKLRDAICDRDQLCHAQFEFRLQGSYAKLKRVLAESLAARQEVTLNRLRLMPVSQSENIEASIVLTVWARPTASGSDGHEARAR